MFRKISKNILRRPAYSLSILLFAAVLSLVLCYLYHSQQQEQQSYERTYASVPVTFRVTALDGSKPESPKYIEGWVADLFSAELLTPNLKPFVGQLYTRVSYAGSYTAKEVGADGLPFEQEKSVTVAGIDSLYVAQELTEDWGGSVQWLEGYDERILQTQEPVLLLPDTMQDTRQLSLTFEASFAIPLSPPQVVTVVKDFTVVGYYSDKGNSNFYCNYSVMSEIYAKLNGGAPAGHNQLLVKSIEEQCAVLNDNGALQQLREAAELWFAKPNPNGEKTQWGHYGYAYYLYALDIDDYMLRTLESDLKSSMRLNKLAAVAVFALSAGAGFLTGFLVIRARKREVALMRTMGSSHTAIFMELALEQLLCLLAGIALGGAVFLWQPVRQLALFGGIYFVGLSISLVIFLSRNLLATMKEDE